MSSKPSRSEPRRFRQFDLARLGFLSKGAKSVYGSTILGVFAIAMLLVVSSLAADQSRLDLAVLHGDWEGSGTFLMPVTDIEFDISGKASFRYNSSTGRLHTAISGEKFMFTYSDSGYVMPDANGDSLTWEIWDNFGRHSKYRGAFEKKTIKGKRKWRGKIYTVEMTKPHSDTVFFRMLVAGDKGNSKEKASFKLWRVK